MQKGLGNPEPVSIFYIGQHLASRVFLQGPSLGVGRTRA